MLTITQTRYLDERTLQGLCTLLIETVNGGSSVGFLAPLSLETAMTYWQGVFASLGPNHHLWTAQLGEEVVGTVQLDRCAKENGRHRAEIQKLFVLPRHRGYGISTALMRDAEQFAAQNGISLLILDTEAGSKADSVYQHLGWSRVGEIPNYALTSEGGMTATAYFYKEVGV